jgi:hypothetical protein
MVIVVMLICFSLSMYFISVCRCFADDTIEFAICYSLRSIKHVANIDVSRHILVIDTSIFVTCFMERREY